jgi:hypothetical protein
MYRLIKYGAGKGPVGSLILGEEFRYEPGVRLREQNLLEEAKRRGLAHNALKELLELGRIPRKDIALVLKVGADCTHPRNLWSVSKVLE